MAGAPHLEAFIEAAWYFYGLTEDGTNSFSDPRGQEMWDLFGSDASGTAWCAILVSACAEKAGVGDVLIYKTAMAGWLQEATCLYYEGEWIEGPYMNGGVGVIPMVGDIISFGNEECHGYGHAYHVGMVIGTSDTQVHTMEGNSGDMCTDHWYDFDDGRINMYVRPNWAKVGDDVSEYSEGTTSGSGGSGSGGYVPLYNSRNDRHDMTIREVCYLSTGYSLTNNPTSLAVSILNYTSFLADLYDYLGIGNRGSGSSKVTVDTSGLNEYGEDVKNTVDYLLEKNYSASASCGIAACLMTYSGLNVAYLVTKASGVVLEGIGAWEPDKYQAMRDRAGYDGRYTLSGQLEYFVYDLETNYAALVSSIKFMQYGSVQAEEVANKVIWKYNNHYFYSDYEKEAKEWAKKFYDALKFVNTSTHANGKNLVDIDGRQLSPQFTVDIPRDLSQAGIDGNYTSYSYFYNVWDSSSPQRVVADNWAYQGFPYDRGIALVGGYYCIATTPTFGSVGDVVVVTLENDESFAAILADIKNPSDSNYCEYGHYYGNGLLNVIEWERIVTYNGEVQTKETGAGATLVDDIDLGSWAGQDVVSITNYGSYGL